MASDARWADALAAARLLAAHGAALGGAVVRAPAGPARDRWLEALRAAADAQAPWQRLPPGCPDTRLAGGLDLAATLAAGRPLSARGILARADGGFLVVAMAERLAAGAAGLIALAMDGGALADQLGTVQRARFALLLLDEGEGEEAVHPALADRVAFHLDLGGVRPGAVEADRPRGPAVADPARRVAEVGAALGVPGLRPLLFALAVARAEAAGDPDEAALGYAARLVLAPRATRLPERTRDAAAEPAPAAAPATAAGDADGQAGGDVADRLVETALSALPERLIGRLAAAAPPPATRRASGNGRGAGRMVAAPGGGRPGRIRQGSPRPGVRLDLLETLKAAAPWQRVRQPQGGATLAIRRDDLRVRGRMRRQGTTILFAVDASGSTAAARLGEAKGAVELLLADAYVRRDEAALLVFRGDGAELLLPPTRSLARARRALADMAGGGGTPLAAALRELERLCVQVRGRGGQPLAVLLTDGRANMGDGPDPMGEALAQARRLGAAGVPALVVDTAARPRGDGARLAEALGARLVPLPRVAAAALRDAVRAVA